jgi:hypothetical protein
MPQKAAPRWVGDSGPTEEERGRMVRSGDGESVAETGVEATASHATRWGVPAYPRAGAALDDGLHGTHSAAEACPAERPARELCH